VSPFLPTSWLQSCLHETACWTNRWASPTSLPIPWENNPVQPLGRLNPTTAKLKNLISELKSNTNSVGGGGTLNLPWRMGLGPGAEFSAPNSQWNAGKAAKAESGDGITSQTPRGDTST
jgi:hypothetical protein